MFEADVKELINKLNLQISNSSTAHAPLVSAITEDDRELFTSYLQQAISKPDDVSQINFENSFEYIRLYFNSGRYIGFKYHTDNYLIVFALEKKKKAHFKLFKPLGNGAIEECPGLIRTLSLHTAHPIQLVCLDSQTLKALKKEPRIDLKNIKEFKYYIYDLRSIARLAGRCWKNVRQKIATFNKNHSGLSMEPLSMKNATDVVHFIGEWRRQLLNKRELSYSNLEKNKFAALYYSDKNDSKNVWASVYSLDGRVVSFQLLYRLGENTAAHTIGLADTSINGLSEAAQLDVWERLNDHGVRYINDGASWRPGLDRYKQKFNPIGSQQVFECKVSIQ